MVRVYNKCRKSKVFKGHYIDIPGRKFLVNFIRAEVKRNKNHFPRNIKIYIYDNDCDNCTSIAHDNSDLTINLAELLHYYKKQESISRDIPDFKNFKAQILFALYHELGHSKLRRFYYNYQESEYKKDRHIFELQADKFARLYLKKRGVLNGDWLAGAKVKEIDKYILKLCLDNGLDNEDFNND